MGRWVGSKEPRRLGGGGEGEDIVAEFMEVGSKAMPGNG